MKQEVFDKVLDHIINGFPLCKALQDVKVSSSTFYKFLEEDIENEKRYTRACEERSEFKVLQMHEIADTEPDVNRARLKVDVIKWEAAKLKPKKYGDKLINEHDGQVKHIIEFKK